MEKLKIDDCINYLEKKYTFNSSLDAAKILALCRECKAKIIAFQPDDSDNEAKQPENKKDGEVALPLLSKEELFEIYLAGMNNVDSDYGGMPVDDEKRDFENTLNNIIKKRL